MIASINCLQCFCLHQLNTTFLHTTVFDPPKLFLWEREQFESCKDDSVKHWGLFSIATQARWFQNYSKTLVFQASLLSLTKSLQYSYPNFLLHRHTALVHWPTTTQRASVSWARFACFSKFLLTLPHSVYLKQFLD